MNSKKQPDEVIGEYDARLPVKHHHTRAHGRHDGFGAALVVFEVLHFALQTFSHRIQRCGHDGKIAIAHNRKFTVEVAGCQFVGRLGQPEQWPGHNGIHHVAKTQRDTQAGQHRQRKLPPDPCR